MKRVSIIGGGNLGSSIARGLKDMDRLNVHVTGRNKQRLVPLEMEGLSVSTDNKTAAKIADYIVLCVQPGQVKTVLEEIGPVLEDSQVIISTATGVSIEEIKTNLPTNSLVVRAMPNTASSIGESMTCLCSEDLTTEKMDEVGSLFKSIGKTIVIEEQLMQAATVLGASGIAFFLRFIRATTQGGIQMGFHPHEAQLIAVQTAIGAASLLNSKANHPEMEIDRVTTPKGCTIEGLNEMEHKGLSSAVIKGIMASYEKINSIR